MVDTGKSVAYISLKQFENQSSVPAAIPIIKGNNSDHRSNFHLKLTNPAHENDDTYVNQADSDQPLQTYQSAASQVVKDRFHFVYISLVLSGVAFLLPYNCFVNAVDYYKVKYGPSSIIFDFTTTYITVMLITVLVNNVFVKVINFRMRIISGYLLAFVTLSFLTYFDVYLQLFSSSVSYRLTLVTAAFVSLGCTAQQASFYGYSSMLPRRFTQAVMSGESISGVLASSLRLLSEFLFPSSPAVFFVISSILLIVCLLIFHLSVRSQFVRYHLEKIDRSATTSNNDFQNYFAEENVNLGFIDEEFTKRGMLHAQLSEEPPEAVIDPEMDSSDDLDNRNSMDSSQLPDIIESSDGPGRLKHNWLRILIECIHTRWTVTKQIWTKMLAIGLAYMVTLSVFPGIETEIASREWPKLIPIILIFVFNITDLAGKLLAGIPVMWSGRTLIIGSASRCLIVPMLMMCATPTFNERYRVDTASIIVTSLLGLTNGYFGSLPMILAPFGLTTQAEKELAGNLMTLSYSVGLTVGCLVAYGLNSVLLSGRLHTTRNIYLSAYNGSTNGSTNS